NGGNRTFKVSLFLIAPAVARPDWGAAGICAAAVVAALSPRKSAAALPARSACLLLCHPAAATVDGRRMDRSGASRFCGTEARSDPTPLGTGPPRAGAMGTPLDKLGLHARAGATGWAECRAPVEPVSVVCRRSGVRRAISPRG